MKTAKHYEFDVAISFAGEDREYAEALAETLRYHQLNVFYDNFEKPTLWGKNLYSFLSDVYENKAHYCVMFLSQHYAAKLWTNHERQAAQARAFKEIEEYILPIRLDDAEIPGILPTIAYLRMPPETIDSLADIILTKLGREPYVPSPQPTTTEATISATFQSDIQASAKDKGSKTKEQAEDALLQAYLEKIETIYQTDKATELTYRPALQELLEKLVSGISVTHEPMREDYGSPDDFSPHITSYRQRPRSKNKGQKERKQYDGRAVINRHSHSNHSRCCSIAYKLSYTQHGAD